MLSSFACLGRSVRLFMRQFRLTGLVSLYLMLENFIKIYLIILVLAYSFIMMDITIEKDWDWYLAKVVGKDNYFAFWSTEEEALDELQKVIQMINDFNEEQSAKNNN